MRRTLLLTLLLGCASAQEHPNFLRQIFGAQPDVSLLLANRNVEITERRGPKEVLLRAPGSKVTLVARFEREGAFDFCRIGQEAGSPVTADELKLIWSFPLDYNESMTLDAGALQGHPLHLPDGTIPPAHFLNWGTLFYKRASNLALGAVLDGAEPAATRWGGGPGRAVPRNSIFGRSPASRTCRLRYSLTGRKMRGCGGRSGTRSRRGERPVLTLACSPF